MRNLLVRASILVLVFVLGCPQSPGESGPNKVDACDTPGVSTCAPEMDSRGARARFCAATQNGNYCLNVCNADNTDFAPGSQPAGAQCEYDVDCAAGSMCDNDRVGGAATCKCIADPVCKPSYTVGVRQVFGDERVGAGERWYLARTCKRTDGTCVTPELTIGIAVNAADIAQTRWGVEGVLEEVFEGRFCGAVYEWAEAGAVEGEYETGKWTFSTDEAFREEVTIFDRPGGAVVAKCDGAGRKATASQRPTPVFDCASYNPTFPCMPAFDISGTFTERFSCSQTFTGMTPFCADPDQSSTLTVRKSGTTPSEYSFSDGASFSGKGDLCDKKFVWTATETSGPKPYTERGTWTFIDAKHWTQQSTYTFNDGSATGVCSATGAVGETPPKPAPVGACP